MIEDLFTALQPTVTACDLELVDAVLAAGVLQVTVDREGGVDLEALTDASRAVSAVLDDLDPVPGRYSLEVSSPGIERTLRTPAHFIKAVGATVTIKTRPQVPGDRRRRGTLLEADQNGFLLDVDGTDDAPMRVAYCDIDRARTVFVWGASDRVPGRPSGKKTQTKAAEKRKQVVTP